MEGFGRIRNCLGTPRYRVNSREVTEDTDCDREDFILGREVLRSAGEGNVVKVSKG